MDFLVGQSATWRRVLSGLNSPLRVRVHVLIASGAMVTILAVWVGGVSETNAVRVHELQEYQAKASAMATSVSARLAVTHASIDATDDLVAHGHDQRDLCETMGRPQKHEYQRLDVFALDGRLRCSTVPGTLDEPGVILQRPSFQAALATGDNQVGGPLVETSSGRLSLLLVHPIRSGSQLAGIAMATIDAAVLFDPTQVTTGSKRELVFGRDGGWFEIGSQGATLPPFGVSGAASRSVATGEPCPVTIEGTAAWTCSPVGRSGLAIVTAHPEALVFANVSTVAAQIQYRIVGVVVIAIMAGFLSDFLFLRRIRLAYGNASLARLNAGDTVRQDEIDALGDWARTAEATHHRLRLEVDGYERRQRNSERDLLTSIAETVEIRYPFLRNHGDRVGRYARQIGARLGFNEQDLELLEFAARVHDLGKIAIADAVYLKPGQLDPIETAQMQLHAARGGEIARRMRNVPPEVAEAIRHHHERWDGTGYPDGLAGTAIPLWSRVIAVADAYDAMTEERPYRERPHTHDEAVQILRDGIRSQWDATAVQAFFDVLESGGVQPKPVSIASRHVAETWRPKASR